LIYDKGLVAWTFHLDKVTSELIFELFQEVNSIPFRHTNISHFVKNK